MNVRQNNLNGFAFSTLFLALTASSPAVIADEQITAGVVSDLTLEDLLDLTVSVASSRPEPIPETPAIVSRYEADNLKQMGLRSFKEFLGIIPGVQVQDSYGTSVVSIRGIFEGFNQKVLFLLNGVPYFMPSHSDIPLLGMPLEAISHIEVIRGPGAVYHGTNASAGVINVVTKSKGEQSVTLSGGSNSLVNSSGYFTHNLGDDFDVSYAYEKQVNDGFNGLAQGTDEHKGLPDEDIPTEGQIPRGNEMESMLLNIHYKDTNLMLQYFDSETKVLAGFASSISDSINHHTGYLAHVNHAWNLDDTAIKVYGDYNQYSFELPVDAQAPGGADGGFRFEDDTGNYRIRTGTSVNHRIDDTLDFYAVLEAEKRSVDEYVSFNEETNQIVSSIVSPDDVHEYSIASQFDWNLDDLRILIGGRYTDNEVSGSKLTPRLSAVIGLNDNQSLKLLYAQGFNSPNFLQQKINIPNVIVGNPDLTAEKVATTDIVYTYYSNKVLFSVNAFYLEAKDFIERYRIESGEINYDNIGNFDRWGFELDYQYSVYNWKSFANLGYMHQGDEDISDDRGARFMPKLTMAGGISYQINKYHGIGASARVIGERNDIDALFIANLDYRFTYDQLEFNATIKNATDEEITNTDVTNLREEAYLEGEDGVNLLMGIKYTF